LLELLQITQEQIKTEKIKYEELNAKGFDERKIKIIIIQLDKDRHIKKFLEQLNTKMNKEDKEIILNQKNRLDEDLNFYIRLDKQKLQKGTYKLTNSGKCYHIKINIAAFPKKTENAWKTIKQIFT
ncbi:hypothetical protein K9K83_06380, partial [Candidatus Woesearchaeota archaeon]|nr:hypothetical protein [Candidatus Woesearchaeota archaeon]